MPTDYPVATGTQLCFVFVAIYLYRNREAAAATALAVVGGMLFLPEIALLNIPSVPYIGKDRVTYLAAFIAILLFKRQELFASRPGIGPELFVFFFVVLNVLSYSTNDNVVINEGAIQDGLSVAWIIGQTLDDLLRFLLPFTVGRAMFRSIDDVSTLMKIMVGFGLVYTIFIVIEVIMSIPFVVFQFSQYIYDLPGRAQFRYGFNEPSVFMGRGHTVATFMVTAVIAAIGLQASGEKYQWWKITSPVRYTMFGLIATMKLASTIFGLVSLFAYKLFNTRRVALIAFLIALGVCIYPALRMADLFPRDLLVTTASEINPSRAASLNGRFEEEDFVLDNIGDRLLFGWGHFARIPGAATYGGDTGEPGLDAWWVIRTGMAGLVGVELVFLMFLIPIARAKKLAARSGSQHVAAVLSAIMLCAAIRMSDLLLNGWWNSFPIFLAGVLWGATSGDALDAEHTAVHATRTSGGSR